MRSKNVKANAVSPAFRWVALLCLLLIGIVAVAQALHSHPNELANDAKHCSTCQVAHAPATVGLVPHVAYRPSVQAFLVSPANAQPKAFLVSFSLFSRPPPAV